MICGQCTTENEPESVFCLNCGGTLSARSAASREWVVGRDPACDIVIARDTVSQRHCILRRNPEGFTLEDLGSANGTWVNGMRINRITAVTPADSIRLGHAASLPWPEPVTQRAQQVSRIGRGPHNDIVLDLPMVSWDHAQIVRDNNGVWIEDLGAMNGLFLNVLDPQHQVNGRAALTGSDSVYFGTYRVPAAQLLSRQRLTRGPSVQQTVPMRTDTLMIGRDPDCDYPIDDPKVSWRHAQVSRTAAGLEVQDLGSMNGTYVNGRRISGTVRLQPDDVLTIGSLALRFTPEGTIQKRDYRGNITLDIRSVGIGAILSPVTLTIFPGELVGVMGPSGAGKTTFLNAINGYTNASGQILINGLNLYANYDAFRLQMGYVPQEDIMHPQLTVREALYYTARLRTDLSDREIETLIDETLDGLQIRDCAGKEIGSADKKVISGGERKRVNIAMELISRPSLLFLDEPTSGLSSEDADSVVKLLKSKAEAGTTILLTIHQPSLEIFRTLDSLIVIGRHKAESREAQDPGSMIYFGPAWPDSLMFFNPEEVRLSNRNGKDPGPELLFKGLQRRGPDRKPLTPISAWKNKYDGSRYKKEFVDDRSGRQPSTPPTSVQTAKPVRRPNLKQIGPLTRRAIVIKLRDRLQTAVMLLQAPIIAALLLYVFRDLGDATHDKFDVWKQFTGRIASTHFMMVVAAVWFGCNNAARDIVGEWAVYRRERMVNLKIPSYIMSKIAVLGSVSAIQCVVLLGLVWLSSGLRAPFGAVYAMLLLASLVGSSIGLCISSIVKTTESAIATLPIVLLPMILLGGGMKPLHEFPSRTVAAIIPTRWAFEANLRAEAVARAESSRFDPSSDPASKAQIETLRAKGGDVPIYLKDTTNIAEGHFRIGDPKTEWLECAGILGGMFAIWTVTVGLILRSRDIR